MTSTPQPRKPGENGRWVARDKAEIIRQLQAREMTVEEALERYGLTEEELESWVARLRRHGHEGLKVTKIQDRPL